MDKIISRLCMKNIRSFHITEQIVNQFLNKANNFNEICSKKSFSTNYPASNMMKVTILGAGGNLGKSVSLMLKQSPLIDELCLFDNKSLAGFVTDLNYIDTKCIVTSYSGSKEIKPALSRANLVVVLPSSCHSGSLNYDNLFEKNAAVVKEFAVHVAKFSPKSVIAIATEPINSIVPMFSEVMKKHGHYNPNSIFGITTIDVVRTNKFVAEVMGLDPECVVVPLIGGHTEKTIIPVLSKAAPCNNFTNEELEDITNSVRTANDSLMRIRSCEGAYLSNAFAVSRFVISLLKALKGHSDVVECAYVKSSAHPQLKYMITPLLLGPGGIMKNLGMPELSDYEYCLFENAIPILIEDIKRGEYVGGRAMDCVKGKLEEKPLCDPCDPDPKAPPCPPDHCELQSMIAADKR